MLKHVLVHVLVLGCVFAGFWGLARGVAWYGPYIYDQADYMYAASLGWKANAFDAPSISFTDFLKTGWDRGRDSAQRAGLSAEIRASNDVLFYRHWHGPLYGYWLALARQFTTDARSMRKLNYLFAGATTIFLYFGALRLFKGAAGEIAALLGSILYLWSYPVIKSSEVAPHQLFGLLTMMALLSLSKIFDDPLHARRWWYVAVGVSALIICVLEVAFAVLLTLMACGWMARRELNAGWRFWARSLGLFTGTVLITWPAAMLKASAVKSYLFLAYLAVFRRAAFGDDVGFTETWRLRFLHSPVLWILLSAAVYFLWRQRAPALKPPLIFAALMLLFTFRVTSTAARYELPLLPGIVLLGACAAGLTLARWTPARRYVTLAIICSATFLTSWRSVRAELPQPEQQTDAILELLRAQASGQVVLVPHEDLPMAHYYFPQVRFRGYYQSDTPVDLVRDGVATVVTRGNPPRLLTIP